MSPQLDLLRSSIGRPKTTGLPARYNVSQPTYLASLPDIWWRHPRGPWVLSSYLYTVDAWMPAVRWGGGGKWGGGVRK